MNWFKSIWLKLRKSNGMPGNEVLVPITELPKGTDITVIVPEQKPKRKYVRKKKDVTH